ncbi:MAG TPA: FtsX-like permease family protein [Acidobacteriota bacterium]|jgi:putative ABC transport system permease protein
MLLYHLRIAFKSLRRNPILSTLIIFGIALGIGVSTTFMTTHHLLSGNPIPHKSDRLYYVELDSWDPARGWDDSNPKATPNQLTYRDTVEIMKSNIPTYQGGSFKASLYVHPPPNVGRPFKVVARMCFSDFFPLFDVPFQYGSGWPRSADAGPEQVVVLDNETNQKVFGGRNSVGKLLRVEDREFKVVGVLKPWFPRPKFFDVHNGAFEKPEEIYLPFNFVRPLELYSAGNTSGWKNDDGEGFEAHLNGESIWIQMWVQLDTEKQKEAYMDFLNSYVKGQKLLGRMQRPLNNKLLPVMEWMKIEKVVPEEATSMLVISMLFLVVCALNLIGILLGKFLGRAPEVGVRRALGASKWSIFVQHIIECELVGVLGGVLGVLLSIGGLKLINSLFEINFKFQLDGLMVIAAIGLALTAGLIAGLYPAWRICSIPPAVYLKEQ